MTNTINVPRYRVEKTGRGFWPYCVRAGDGTREVFVGHQKQCAVVAAELETAFEDGKFVSYIAPAPAGVDGLEVVGVLCISRFRNNPAMENVEFQLAADVEQGQHDLCRLSDATAIIDGLRDQIHVAHEKVGRYADQRDQQARRIGELEGLLREARQYVAYAFSEGMDGSFTLGVDIDAALSASKEGE